MADTKKYYHNLDVDRNKVNNLLLNPLTTTQRLTVGGTLGLVDQGYVTFDTTLNQQYFWNGTAWILSSGITTWGSITGTITAQTDLTAYLAANYYPLSTNPAGYITSSALTPYLTSATAASTYEPIISAGTTSQYWRGDKTWQTFPTIPTVGTWGALNYPTWVSGTPFVKMNGAGSFTLDTNTYLTSAVTSVAALTLGTTGTDLTSTVANGTTTPVITLNVPTASASNRGALSSTDWSIFNGKFTLPTLTTGSVLFSNGTTIAEDNANFFWDDTNNRLGIGNAIPAYPLDVTGVIRGSSDAIINNITVGKGGGNISSNTVLGNNSLNNNSTGNQNISIGQNSLLINNIGSQNTAVGADALRNNTSGSFNTAVGLWALRDNTTGSFNTSLGLSSGREITIGSNNISIGYLSGGGIISGSQNTIIGNNTNGLAAGLSNTVIIADGAGSYRFYSPSTGNILFGSTTDSGQMLQVTGTAIISSTTTLSSLAGVGSRMVVANSLGVVSTIAIPSSMTFSQVRIYNNFRL